VRTPQIGFGQLVQDFFLRRLVAQRGASARTIESYRDAFELLFGFVEDRTGKPPSALQLADLDAPFVLDFLDHLETERGNSVRTRNARLAAIHSFMRYASIRDPASLPTTQRVLAIPAKRFDRPVLGYLTREQVTAILAAPDRGTWSGHRDAVLLATAYNTGARVSELTGLQVRDVLLDRQTAVHLHGKGRKQRAIPLWKNTATELRGWLHRINSAPDAPVFPNRAGAPLTRSGVRDRLNRAVAIAEQRCPSLHGQHITPHTCDTRRPCTCCNRGQIWLSSPYGSDTPAPPSRTSTSKKARELHQAKEKPQVTRSTWCWSSPSGPRVTAS
jgi:integrase/recombinase XerD